MNSRRIMRFLRTTQGQLTVIGVAFGGSLVLALVAVFLLTDWFDGKVYEKFPRTNRKLAGEIATGTKHADELKDLESADVRSVYAAYINEKTADADGRLAAAMCRHQATQVIVRVRRTLVVGNRRQRLRALVLLGSMTDQAETEDACRLCRYAVRRASRCGDSEIEEKASALLRRFEN